MKKYLLLFLFANTLFCKDINNIILNEILVQEHKLNKLDSSLLIDSQIIDNGKNQNLEDVFNKISEIDFIDFGLGKNIDIRGQGKKANIGVKVLVDGKSINSLDSVHGITNLSTLVLDNIEEIEIIPGGGSVLYGSRTRGGSVIIKTKDLRREYFSISFKNDFFDKNRFFNPSFSSLISKKIQDNLFVKINFWSI